MKWRDIVFDAYGVRLNITDMKTKKLRYSRLVLAKDYLAQWKNDSHFSREDSAEAFVSMIGEPMEYGAMVMVIRRTAKRAGITKRVHPHLFRKSRITHLIQQNWQETVIKQMMWGNLATDMFRTSCIPGNT